MQALVDFAKREPTAMLPGYTHLRRAQGVLWAHYCLAYFEMFARDWERLEQAHRRTDVLPYGVGRAGRVGFSVRPRSDRRRSWASRRSRATLSTR